MKLKLNFLHSLEARLAQQLRDVSQTLFLLSKKLLCISFMHGKFAISFVLLRSDTHGTWRRIIFVSSKNVSSLPKKITTLLHTPLALSADFNFFFFLCVEKKTKCGSRFSVMFDPFPPRCVFFSFLIGKWFSSPALLCSRLLRDNLGSFFVNINWKLWLVTFV